MINNTLMPKRLELLHQLVPQAGVIAFLVNSTGVTAAQQVREAEAAAKTLGVRLVVLNASRSDEIDAAFTSLSQQGAAFARRVNGRRRVFCADHMAHRCRHLRG